MRPYAEVIGDPIAHSKSPLIHGFWLDALGIDADYRRTRVTAETLAAYLEERRIDPEWRGCNVTAPLKQAILPLLDDLPDWVGRLGAVNCVLPRDGKLAGHNSDVDGIAAAIGSGSMSGRTAVVIGAGGAARAIVHHLVERDTARIRILARDPARIEPIRAASGASARIEAGPLAEPEAAIAGADLIVNASPLGMDHAAAMPQTLLDALSKAAPGAIVFDMVYDPLDTPLLDAARRHGLPAVDGLTMLVGQADAAFRLFFGRRPPREGDEMLRRQLTACDAANSFR